MMETSPKDESMSIVVDRVKYALAVVEYVRGRNNSQQDIKLRI